MAITVWPNIPMDLNILSFEEVVCHYMLADPIDAVLYCGKGSRRVARDIEIKTMCTVVLVPDGMLKNSRIWLVQVGTDAILVDPN